MKRKKLLTLILAGCILIAGLIYSITSLVDNGKDKSKVDINRAANDQNEVLEPTTAVENNSVDETSLSNVEPWLNTNPSETGSNGITIADTEGSTDPSDLGSENTGTIISSSEENNQDDLESLEAFGDAVSDNDRHLIYDSSKVDYEEYIPDMASDSTIQQALNIANPDIDIQAEAAILLDANTGAVLYYKNPVEAVFPASTAKLLNALVAVDWYDMEESITVGDEVKMIAPDSSRAYLKAGEILTAKTLLEGMLLPSGNDAAYVMAVNVGRKSLGNKTCTNEEAVKEFSRLMNEKAKELGARNSCFVTPDGYDAIGQYTTAYDMGMIGMAAVKNETIMEVCNMSSTRNIFVSGEDITWENTNALIKQGSAHYYSCANGLKTGTSTMAGCCLISAAKKDGKEVVSVILGSTSSGRWEDSLTLLKYALN